MITAPSDLQLPAAGFAVNTPYAKSFIEEHQVAVHNHAAIMDIETVAEIIEAAACREAKVECTGDR
uniref:Uncharacterized protein n=1 Tax=Candidatus Kentrum sp. FW TaxID=2126338 RepID=A0A450T7X9_9GAMM|nr:MAG: hypothetical protein BECKFW1821C_GA0114237_100357 [Candidatus Kentron sp. FW]